MIIFGVAFLALCTLSGLFAGELLGTLLGVPANVGGVGIAMVLLILLGSYLKNRGLFKADTEQGVKFWSAVYIPIVVAMAAQQNVYGALSGGPMAILAGVAAVVLAFALLPVLDRIGRKKPEAEPAAAVKPVVGGVIGYPLCHSCSDEPISHDCAALPAATILRAHTCVRWRAVDQRRMNV